MKKLILGLITLIIILIIIACSTEEPGYFTIVDSESNPIVVKVDGNPEIQIVDEDGDMINIDSLSNSIIIVDFELHELHEGKMFSVIELTDLGNGATRDILVVSPDTTRQAHLVWEIEHELETSIEFYRDTIYSNNGTPIPSFNRNDNSTNVATTLVYHSPTVSNNGALIGKIQQGAGKKAGGSDRQFYEFILKRNSAYLIKIENKTASNNLIFIKLNWYEHDGGG